MISNNGRFANGTGGTQMQQRPRVQETEISSKVIQIERKKVTIKLAENPQGKLLRITEEAGNRRDVIVLPADGYKELAAAILEVGSALEQPAA